MATNEQDSLRSQSFSNQCFFNRRSFLKRVSRSYSRILRASWSARAARDRHGKRLESQHPWTETRIRAAVGNVRLHAHMDARGQRRDHCHQGLTTADLDYLMDRNANTIGGLMLHLAATETYDQLNTFENKKWDTWPDSVKQQWDAAMNLGDAGRKTIKGHDRDYYLNILRETRAKSLAEFGKRDDTWLMAVDKDWPWGPTNNYCKWFHVCEHEAHHTGQIAFLRKRLPGAKPDTE